MLSGERSLKMKIDESRWKSVRGREEGTQGKERWIVNKGVW